MIKLKNQHYVNADYAPSRLSLRSVGAVDLGVSYTNMAVQITSQPLIGKAVTYNDRGGYEVIEILERQVRPPAAGEVRIEVKAAAAVNPMDTLFRATGSGDQTSLIVPGMEQFLAVSGGAGLLAHYAIAANVIADAKPEEPGPELRRGFRGRAWVALCRSGSPRVAGRC